MFFRVLLLGSSISYLFFPLQFLLFLNGLFFFLCFALFILVFIIGLRGDSLGSFLASFEFVLDCLPTWVHVCLFAFLGIVVVLIVLSVVKAVLDAIPFV